MNLICFPHYTCGGLLCDILTDNFSKVNPINNGIDGIVHNIGKIGDSKDVFTNFNQEQFVQQLNKLNLRPDDYVGTHCWPGDLDTSLFNQIICVTTMTYRSKIYRWARAFYHYYENSDPWQLSGSQLIDKQRETAKNYLIPFVAIDSAVNIEFSEVVDNTVQFQKLINGHDAIASLERWRDLNKFLYDPAFWNSVPVQRYYEAESEVLLKQYYIYE